MTLHPLTDGKQRYFYTAFWNRKGNSTEHTASCDVDSSTCTIEDLSPAEPYELRVRTCYAPYNDAYHVCAHLSETITEWTSPYGKYLLIHSNKFSLAPESPTFLNVTEDSIYANFTELTDGIQEYLYRLYANGPNDTVHTAVCNITDHICDVRHLIPARSYEVGLKACFIPVENKTVCSKMMNPQTAWTKPGGNPVFFLC